MLISSIRTQEAAIQPQASISNNFFGQDRIFSATPPTKSCYQKIQEWFSRKWDAIVQAFRTCFCLNKKVITAQTPVNPQVQPQVAPIQQPERNALPEDFMAPILRVLNQEPNDDRDIERVRALAGNNLELAKRAAIGAASYMRPTAALDQAARITLAEDYFLRDPAMRRAENITDEEFERLQIAALALVNARVPTFELRQNYLLALIGARHLFILGMSQANIVFAAGLNHIPLSQALVQMGNAVERRNQEDFNQAAQVLAEMGDHFRHQLQAEAQQLREQQAAQPGQPRVLDRNGPPAGFFEFMAEFMPVMNQAANAPLAPIENVWAFAAQNPELARRAAVGVFSYAQPDESIDRTAAETLADNYHLRLPANRFAEHITNEEFDRLVDAARALVDAPVRTVELRKNYMIAIAETRYIFMLGNARANAVYAAAQNFIPQARVMRDLGNALHRNDEAAALRAANILAAMGDHFRNQH